MEILRRSYIKSPKSYFENLCKNFLNDTFWESLNYLCRNPFRNPCNIFFQNRDWSRIFYPRIFLGISLLISSWILQEIRRVFYQRFLRSIPSGISPGMSSGNTFRYFFRKDYEYDILCYRDWDHLCISKVVAGRNVLVRRVQKLHNQNSSW